MASTQVSSADSKNQVLQLKKRMYTVQAKWFYDLFWVEDEHGKSEIRKTNHTPESLCESLVDCFFEQLSLMNIKAHEPNETVMTQRPDLYLNNYRAAERHLLGGVAFLWGERLGQDWRIFVTEDRTDHHIQQKRDDFAKIIAICSTTEKANNPFLITEEAVRRTKIQETKGLLMVKILPWLPLVIRNTDREMRHVSCEYIPNLTLLYKPSIPDSITADFAKKFDLTLHECEFNSVPYYWDVVDLLCVFMPMESKSREMARLLYGRANYEAAKRNNAVHLDSPIPDLIAVLVLEHFRAPSHGSQSRAPEQVNANHGSGENHNSTQDKVPSESLSSLITEAHIFMNYHKFDLERKYIEAAYLESTKTDFYAANQKQIQNAKSILPNAIERGGLANSKTYSIFRPKPHVKIAVPDRRRKSI